jgi:hypothetical protein
VYNRGDEGKVENLRQLTGEMLAECRESSTECRESCTPHNFVVKGGFRVCQGWTKCVSVRIPNDGGNSSGSTGSWDNPQRRIHRDKYQMREVYAQ